MGSRVVVVAVSTIGHDATRWIPEEKFPNPFELITADDDNVGNTSHVRISVFRSFVGKTETATAAIFAAGAEGRHRVEQA